MLGPSALILVTRLILFIVGVFQSVFIARTFGAEGKGLFTLFLTLVTFLRLFARMGLGQAAVYYLGHRIHPRETVGATILTSGVALSALLTCSLVPLSLRFPVLVEGFPRSPGLFIGIFLSVAASTLNLFSRHLFLSDGAYICYNGANILWNLVPFAVMFLIAPRTNVLGAVTVFVAGRLVSTVPVVYALHRYSLVGTAPRWRVFQDLVGYGFWGGLGSILYNLMLRSDIFLVNSALGVESVGYYSVAVGLVEKLMYIPESIAPVLFQQVCSAESSAGDQLTARVSRISLTLGIPAAFLLLIITRPAIRVLFPGFEAAVGPAYVLLAGVPLLGVFWLLRGALLGKGRVGLVMFVSALSFSVNLLLNLTLLPIWGVVGSAVASTIAYAVAAVVTLLCFSRITGISLRNILVPTGSDRGHLLAGLKTLFHRIAKSTVK